MKIKVIQEDIDKAIKVCREIGRQGGGSLIRGGRFIGHNQACPISQAIRRQTKKRVTTGNTGTTIGKKCYILPNKAQTFVKTFDNGYRIDDKPVWPIEFEV